MYSVEQKPQTDHLSLPLGVMLMKDDDVSTAGGHSLVGCEECGVPRNDMDQDVAHT